ncbi:MAG: endolytic transglycosylase MltG [Acutalibacteraceae bacterium]|nr:endolytic transglycosylase MltG [Acutalibacteraceae bacterium]
MSDNFKMDLSAEIEAARKKRVGSFKLDVEQPDQDKENEVEEIADKKSDIDDIQDDKDNSDIDTEASARIMADDFSEKYSLHKYTDADQINENDSLENEEFDGEERAIVDSDEISSFSNLEQKHRMDKEERKAIKAYKKSDKKRQKEKAEKNSAMFRMIWFCMVLSVSIVLGMFLWNGVSDLLGISRPEDGETIIIEVPENANFEQIIALLTENDLIKEEDFFRLYATVTNSTDGFEDGIKTMRSNMDYEEILNTLQSGPMLSETVTVQFKEGMSVRQVAEALEDKKVCKAEKFMELCNSDMFDEEYTFLAEIPKNENCVYKLEGYLFPDTYEFYIGEDAEDSIRRFLDNFEYKICTSTSTVSGYTDAVSIETIIKDKGMTINDVIKMSALVQAEAANINDMYVVSSVFYNRLSTVDYGGVSPYGDYDLDKLKSDATLYYPYDAQEDIPSDVVATFKSKYNTYDIAGLTPGAICNPGLDAIDAAIYPDNTDYYYFCHKAPTATDGAKPYYASTFTDHQVNLVAAGLA